MSVASVIRADCVILGGGIAGLWARAALTAAGFGVVLITDQPLGAGQTVASQGILHRGLKYALSREAASAADALESAHRAWSDALAGRGVVDLRAARVLSPCTYLWTRPGALSTLTAAAGALAMKSAASRVEAPHRPEAFAGVPDRIGLWRVDEPCLDAASLVSALAAAHAGPVLESADAAVARNGDGWAVSTPDYLIEARAALFAAGAGNESLLRRVGIDPAPLTQRRPLRMTIARGAPFLLYGHCVKELSDKPRLTITSAEAAGDVIWYIGGDAAERGIGLAPEAHLRSVRDELAACLPWVRGDSLRLAWFDIDRAEGRTTDGKRPDGPVLHAFESLAALWPTKLALAPAAADLALEWIRRALGAARDIPPAASAIRPIAPPPWERSDLTWS